MTAQDKSRNPQKPYDKLTIGVCPDQWGVWFPEDEKQIPWQKALEEMAGVLDGFYTLLVSTADEFAVVRDPIACKPAVIAETDRYVAMASEYRAMAHLPGIDGARLYEPEPGRIYHWRR